jgi:hypothetical protein
MVPFVFRRHPKPVLCRRGIFYNFHALRLLSVLYTLGICFCLLVLSLVIYFGSDGWDAPLSLKEMYSNVDDDILAHAPDYHVNLIAPKEM